MGLITSLLQPVGIGATYAPWHDFWFQRDPRFGIQTQAGVNATPEQAMRLGAVYACVRILSDMVGYLPWHTYARREDGGKDRALTHPLYPLLRRRPNPYQTAIRWRQQGMRHVLLRGNFYNLIVASTRRVRELIPFPEPDRMRVVLLDSGRRGYLYRSPSGPELAFTQDEIFHVMGYSFDGIAGCSVIEYARESVGRASAEELHAALFWSQGGAPRGALVTDAKLTPETRKANEEAWQAAQGGWWNAHKVALLEGGIKWEQIGVTARDAQFIEGRELSVGDLARWFGVPPHMIGDVARSTSWGTGIDSQAIGFLSTTLAPWLTTWEQEADRQLLEDDDEYFTEFLREALLMADLQTRAAAHRTYVDGGIIAPDEVRIQLNLNPIGGAFALPSRAQNIGGGGDPALTTGQRGQPHSPEPPSLDTEDVETESRAHALVARAASRVVRKELAAIQKWAPRYAGNPVGWREWVCEFYGKHAAVLEEALGLDTVQARQYGAAHTAALLEQGVSILEEWDRHAPAALVTLALGEELWHADIPGS